MRVVDPVFQVTSATVLHLSGPSLGAGALGVLIILMPGVLRLWSCNFSEMICMGTARYILHLVSRRVTK